MVVEKSDHIGLNMGDIEIFPLPIKFSLYNYLNIIFPTMSPVEIISHEQKYLPQTKKMTRRICRIYFISR